MQELTGTCWRDKHKTASQVHSAGLQSGWSAQDELLHHVQPQTRLRGPDQGPGQPLRPGVLCWSDRPHLSQAELLQPNPE